MALAFYFSPQSMTAVQYQDDCIKRLRKAGAGHPKGRVYHACFGTSENVAVFDVWTSQAAFEKFGQTLMPVLQEIGVDPGQPRVMEIQNVIVPPAAGQSATRNRAPAKRTSKKSKSLRRPSKKR